MAKATRKSNASADMQVLDEKVGYPVVLGFGGLPEDPALDEGDGEPIDAEFEITDEQAPSLPEQSGEAPQAPSRCPNCDAMLVNIVSGSICPQGCGGLHPKVQPEEQYQAVRAIRVSLLPEAHPMLAMKAHESGEEWCDRSLWLVDKHPGVFRRVHRVGQSVAKPVQEDGALLVRHLDIDGGWRVIAVRRYAPAEQEVMLSIGLGSVKGFKAAGIASLVDAVTLLVAKEKEVGDEG